MPSRAHLMVKDVDEVGKLVDVLAEDSSRNHQDQGQITVGLGRALSNFFETRNPKDPPLSSSESDGAVITGDIAGQCARFT